MSHFNSQMPSPPSPEELRGRYINSIEQHVSRLSSSDLKKKLSEMLVSVKVSSRKLSNKDEATLNKMSESEKREKLVDLIFRDRLAQQGYEKVDATAAAGSTESSKFNQDHNAAGLSNRQSKAMVIDRFERNPNIPASSYITEPITQNLKMAILVDQQADLVHRLGRQLLLDLVQKGLFPAGANQGVFGQDRIRPNHITEGSYGIVNQSATKKGTDKVREQVRYALRDEEIYHLDGFGKQDPSKMTLKNMVGEISEIIKKFPEHNPVYARDIVHLKCEHRKLAGLMARDNTGTYFN